MTSKEGYKISPVERHRLEGFMNAGVFMKLVTNTELSNFMDEIHINIFGKSIQQRKTELPNSWQEDGIDYSQYESPAFGRK